MSRNAKKFFHLDKKIISIVYETVLATITKTKTKTLSFLMDKSIKLLKLITKLF